MAEVAVKKQGEKLPEWPPEWPKFRGPLFTMNPFALMRQFTEEMDRFFHSGHEPGAMAAWMPTIEVKKANGNMVVTAELPGLKKEEIQVEATDDALIVQGERKEEKEEKDKDFFRTERRYGHFYRAIPLWEGANADQAAAEFVNGLLKVTIPVAEKKVTKKEIPVEGEVKVKAA